MQLKSAIGPGRACLTVGLAIKNAFMDETLASEAIDVSSSPPAYLSAITVAFTAGGIPT
ncbi:hypothetical protein ES706_00427 [subsurface metagenome]